MCVNIFMNFIQAPYERDQINCFFRRAPLKQHCLGHRDDETTLLTFRIIKLKIDAYSIFIKLLYEKRYHLLLS